MSSNKRKSFQPVVEMLEKRDLLASGISATLIAATSYSGGVLQVTGTNRADKIEVRLYQDKITVANASIEVDGVLVAEVSAEQLSSISIQGLAGNDKITVKSMSKDAVIVPVTVDGGDGNDQIVGGPGDDSLSGAKGKDTLMGMVGNDYLFGGMGNDSLQGGGGDDRLYGEQGNDSLQGGDGDDTLSGNEGNDALSGNAGNDRFWGGSGNDSLQGGGGDDWLSGDEGNDVISGNAGLDLVLAYADSDLILTNKLLTGAGRDKLSSIEAALLSGGMHNNRLDASAFTGTAILNGGAGDDDLIAAIGHSESYGDDGNDRLQAGNAGDSLHGGFGDDILVGGNGNDYLGGDGGNDQLYGQGGHDALDGDYGDDQLYGGSGNDSLYGGSGDDQLQGGDGANSLYGEYGVDTVNYSFAGQGMTIDLIAGTASGAVTDRLSGIENAVGTRFDDSILGDEGDNRLEGGDGNDRLSGKDGNDTLLGGDGNDILLGGVGVNLLDGGMGQNQYPSMSDSGFSLTGTQDITVRGVDIRFEDGSSAWTSGEIAVATRALDWMRRITGNDRILRDSVHNLQLRFVNVSASDTTTMESKVIGLNSSESSEIREYNWLGQLVRTESRFSRIIYIRDWVDDMEAIHTIAHEVAHNWDEESGRFFDEFKQLSGWLPSEPPTSQYTRSGDGTWCYLTSAPFVSTYAHQSPYEDWAETVAKYVINYITYGPFSNTGGLTGGVGGTGPAYQEKLNLVGDWIASLR